MRLEWAKFSSILGSLIDSWLCWVCISFIYIRSTRLSHHNITIGIRGYVYSRVNPSAAAHVEEIGLPAIAWSYMVSACLPFGKFPTVKAGTKWPAWKNRT